MRIIIPGHCFNMITRNDQAPSLRAPLKLNTGSWTGRYHVQFVALT